VGAPPQAQNTQMTAAPRVVLDTNVVVSALVFATGSLTSLREAWQQERCQPLVSAATASELIKVLRCPRFKLTGDEQQQPLADYLPLRGSSHAFQVAEDAGLQGSV
jgi:uncharacterized protein